MKISGKLMVLGALIVLIVSIGAAVTEQEARNRIGNASINIEEARDDGVPVQRLQDLLVEANQTYKARRKLDSPSFERVIELTDRIENLRQTAERANDEIAVLEQEITEAENEDINTSKSKRFLNLANESLYAGRYDEALERVERSYSALSDARALSVRVQTFYEQESDDIISYAERNRKTLAGVSVAGFAFIFLIFRELKVFRYRRRKSKLQKRIESVENLMKELEVKYYEEQNIPKRAFEIRKNKFREIMNEAETKIPELEERIKESKTFQSLFA